MEGPLGGAVAQPEGEQDEEEEGPGGKPKPEWAKADDDGFGAALVSHAGKYRPSGASAEIEIAQST